MDVILNSYSPDIFHMLDNFMKVKIPLLHIGFSTHEYIVEDSARRSDGKIDEYYYSSATFQKESGTKNPAIGTKKVDFIELLLIDLRENPEITVQQLSDHLQLSRRTILRYLDELKQEGTIQQVGSKRKPKWIIVKENENGR